MSGASYGGVAAKRIAVGALPIPLRARTLAPLDAPSPGSCSVCGACPCSCFVIEEEWYQHECSRSLLRWKCRAEGMDPAGLVVVRSIWDSRLRARLYCRGGVECECYSHSFWMLLRVDKVRQWLPWLLSLSEARRAAKWTGVDHQLYATPIAHARLARAWEVTG